MRANDKKENKEDKKVDIDLPHFTMFDLLYMSRFFTVAYLLVNAVTYYVAYFGGPELNAIKEWLNSSTDGGIRLLVVYF